jgi:hypothetical protein
MTPGPPPRDDRQPRFRPQLPGAAPRPAATGVNGDRLVARQAWLAGFWAFVLSRFRDYAHRTSEHISEQDDLSGQDLEDR